MKLARENKTRCPYCNRDVTSDSPCEHLESVTEILIPKRREHIRDLYLLAALLMLALILVVLHFEKHHTHLERESEEISQRGTSV